MYDYAKVARFNSPRIRITCEIFESLKWFIPINIGNSHWVLMVVYMQDKKWNIMIPSMTPSQDKSK